MSDNDWRTCKTLSRGNSFQWRWKGSSKIEFRDNVPGIQVDTWDKAIDLVSADSNGISIPNFRNRLYGKDTRRAYRLAAILADLGICDCELRGKTGWLRVTESKTSSMLRNDSVSNRAIKKVRGIENHLRNFKNIRSNVNTRLDVLNKLVNSATTPFHKTIDINPSVLSKGWKDLEVKEQLETLDKGKSFHFIYVFSVDKKAIDKFRIDMWRAKDSKRGNRKYSRYNSDNQSNGALYVGSSQGRISTRIQQHLGYGAKGTYSLHMREWINQSWKGTVKVHILRFHAKKIDLAALQAIEDSLWDDLQPAFGRQGAR